MTASLIGSFLLKKNFEVLSFASEFAKILEWLIFHHFLISETMFCNVLLALLTTTVASSETKICNSFSNSKQCQFSLSKIRLYNTTKVAHSGIDQSECLTKLQRFHWSTGVYCPVSLFCGLGINLSRDYRAVVSDEISPVKELCNIWVQIDAMTCGDILKFFYEAKILKGAYE